MPDDAVRAIQKARAAGHLAFINTGRSKGHVIDEKLLSIGWDGIVSGCGTLVEVCGEKIYEVLIDTEEYDRILEISKRNRVRVIIEGEDYIFYEDEDYKDDPYGIMLTKELGPMRRTIYAERGNWNSGKFSVDIDPNFYPEEWFRVLGEKYSFIQHDPVVYEIVPKGHSKATGMLKVLEYLGLKKEDAIAFGDGLNDLVMMKAASISIAPAAAIDEVKKKATFVTDDVEEGGIANAIKRLGLID